MLIFQGVPPLGGVKQRWVGKTSYFEAKCVNISKTVADTLHMHFRLTPTSMILDDLELYAFEFSENFAGFRRFRTQQQLKG